jgi:hypothetical protein
MDVVSPMASEPESNQETSQELSSGETLSVPAAAPPLQPPAQPVVAGPRPAPNYSAVNAIIEKKEDGPGCRCGHTLTAVPAVGEEGTPGYIGSRLILFGGATALEGNSATPPSPAGSAGIRKHLKLTSFSLKLLLDVFSLNCNCSDACATFRCR